MAKNKIYLLFVTVAVLFIALYFFALKQNKPIKTLPYFDPKTYSKTKTETHHTIPSFTFTNQYNQLVTDKITEQKVYVTDFFFTTCQSICPIMSHQLERVYKNFKNRNDFLILSHTVNPETDSVSQLLQYAGQHGVTDRHWLFLTGNKKQLYQMARKGYLLNTEEGNGDEDDFIHTQNFALIDKEKHIRGFYDGTDSSEVTRLIHDIQILFDEHKD